MPDSLTPLALVERLKEAEVRAAKNRDRDSLLGYNTIVEGETLSEAAARIEALETRLKAIADGDVPRPLGKAWRADGQASKSDKCVHDRWMYEDCGNCIEEFAASVLEGGSGG